MKSSNGFVGWTTFVISDFESCVEHLSGGVAPRGATVLSRGHITKIHCNLLNGLTVSPRSDMPFGQWYRLPHERHKFSIRERDNLDFRRGNRDNNLHYADGNDNRGDIRFYWHCCRVRISHPFNGHQSRRFYE
ncbi:hypothetical protein DL765_002650 [Monosporascus sp. GIB2]|nr:hypothetical protein DL765_002650 [Monosporascus sp. GIB2]